MQTINGDFWSGKKVFITGNTGFKGSWLSLWLNHLGATLKGYSLNIPSSPDMFSVCKLGGICNTVFAEIRDLEKLKYELNKFKPDIVVHMAAIFGKKILLYPLKRFLQMLLVQLIFWKPVDLATQLS